MTLTLHQLQAVMPHADERADRYLGPLIFRSREWFEITQGKASFFVGKPLHAPKAVVR